MARINLMGDVMFGELLENYRRGLRTVVERRGIDPFEHVRRILGEADLNVLNLECVLSDSSILEKPFSEILIAPESSVRFLVDNGINIVTTANNHALDHGVEQFERSVGILKENGIKVIGYDSGSFFQKEPLVVDVKGIKIGFLGYNMSNYPDEDKIKVAVRIMRVAEAVSRSVDKLVVSMHWGEEYTNIPPPYVIGIGKKMMESGVDILHGHHSHQIQGVVKDEDGIFAPSLGNFIFDQKVRRNRVTAVLQVEIDDSGGMDFRYLPFYMNDLFQPEPAPRYEEYIKQINGCLAKSYSEGGAEIYADAVRKNVAKGHRDNRIRMRLGMLSHFWDYIPHLGAIARFKGSGRAMYSVIRDEAGLRDITDR